MTENIQTHTHMNIKHKSNVSGITLHEAVNTAQTRYQELLCSTFMTFESMYVCMPSTLQCLFMYLHTDLYPLPLQPANYITECLAI